MTFCLLCNVEKDLLYLICSGFGTNPFFIMFMIIYGRMNYVCHVWKGPNVSYF